MHIFYRYHTPVKIKIRQNLKLFYSTTSLFLNKSYTCSKRLVQIHNYSFCQNKFRQILKTNNSDTIFALSSGLSTAISIIRVSGPDSHKVLEMLSPSQKDKIVSESGLSFPPRTALLRKIYTDTQNLIDTCILMYFPKNNSYNNQEIYEIHVHGSQAVVSLIFTQLKKKGLRMADRGEFTRRAVINGKISLRQAEAIDDLIKSENQFQRQIAITNLLGKGEQYLKKLKEDLIKVLVNNEAYIDFQQDEADVKDDLFDKNKQQVMKVIRDIDKILTNYKNLQIVKNGINVSIIGKPNVGKSTLMNCISKKDVSIVSDEPGTTRDIVQTTIQNSGVAIHLFDTAGLRESSNKIQNQGIRRAKIKIQQSHYRLLVIDPLQEEVQIDEIKNQIIINLGIESFGQFEQQKQQTINNLLLDQKTLIILNKIDTLSEFHMNKSVYIKINSSSSQDNSKILVRNKISASNQEGIQNFINNFTLKIKQEYPIITDNQNTTQKVYFTRQRYFTKLANCRQYLDLYLQESRPDIACQLLRTAIKQISQIFGKVDSQDVLDVLFREFCIGK